MSSSAASRKMYNKAFKESVFLSLAKNLCGMLFLLLSLVWFAYATLKLEKVNQTLNVLCNSFHFRRLSR